MKHEIDLSKYNYNTDLALESIKYNNVDNIKQKEEYYGDIKVVDVNIDSNTNKIINKKIGRYTTICFEDITDNDNKKELIDVLIKYLKKYIKVSNDDLILVVGLGNIKSTPDSLGPKVVDNITITNHIYELGLLDKSYKRICSIKPGVSASTGIETSNIVKSIVKNIKPSIVVIIDSLASASIDRLNRTIQITDTGINPGSGIGNKRKEISFDTLHIPVIAIGVPTVVSISNILYELYNDIPNNSELSELVVTPVEIDSIIDNLTEVISESINKLSK